MNTLYGMLGVLIILAVLMASLALLKDKLAMAAETTRKVAHVIMGLTCLSFPWLFNSVVPVVILCLLAVAFMLWMRNQRNPMRGVLHAVERQSYGEMCFPVAVTVLFAIKQDAVTDYLIPLLILTLADAVGALVGVRYGSAKFSTDEGHKSIEGSVAFFVTAFLSTHIPLLLYTDTGRLESLLIATIIGILIMLVEAIAWKGLDNLFIPLGTFLLLNVYEEMDASILGTRIAALFVIVLFFLLLKKRSFAKDGTLLGGVLTLYLIWAVSGWTWVLTPVLMAVAYSIMCPPSDKDWQVKHGLSDLGAVVGGGLIWLFIAVGFNQPALLVPFVACWAAQVGMIFAAFMTYKSAKPKGAIVTFIGGCLGALCAAPALYIESEMLPLILSLLNCLAVATIATWCMWNLEWIKRGATLTQNRAWRQLLYAFVPSVLIVPLLFLS